MTNVHEVAPAPPAARVEEQWLDPRLHRRVDRALAVLVELDPSALGRRLHESINVDRAHPSAPDGFPTSTPGSNPSSGPSVRMELVDGEVVRPVKLTSVEQAVERRRGLDPDEYHRKVERAVHLVMSAGEALRAAVVRLDQIDQLRSTSGLTSGAPGCWAMERIGQWEEVHATTVIDGEPRRLSNWAYRFHRDHGRLPTIAECQARAAGRRVYVSAGGGAR